MKIAYWIVTVIVGVFMALTGIPDILKIDEAVKVFAHLGYPEYLLPFIGVAKILGGIAIIYPRFPRLKEWAYAGLAFDLIGAFYSHISVGDPMSGWLPPVVGFALLMVSYVLYHRTQDLTMQRR